MFKIISKSKNGAQRRVKGELAKKDQQINKMVRKLYHQAIKIRDVDPGRCIDLCQKVAELQPDHRDIYRVIGDAYLGLKTFLFAFQAYDIALTIAPDNVNALWGKGYCLYLTTRGKEGDDLMRTAIKRGCRRRMPNRFGSLGAMWGWMLWLFSPEGIATIQDLYLNF